MGERTVKKQMVCHLVLISILFSCQIICAANVPPSSTEKKTDEIQSVKGLQRSTNFILDHSVNLNGVGIVKSIDAKNGEIILNK